MKNINELEEENKRLKQENSQYQQNIMILEEKVDYLTNKLYGKKSEKINNDSTPDLFNEAEFSTEKEKTAVEKETITYVRKKKKGGRKELPVNLPREEIIHDISEEEKVCACGSKMTRIGEETSEKLKIIPAEIKVEKHIRPKYACKCCEGTASYGIHPTVKIAPVPCDILPKTICSPSLLTYILVCKFVDGLPFYRIEKVINRIGVNIKRANMCRWVITAYNNSRMIFDCLKEELLKSYYIGIDETPVQVLNEPGKKPQVKIFYVGLPRSL